MLVQGRWLQDCIFPFRYAKGEAMKDIPSHLQGTLHLCALIAPTFALK